MSIFETTLIKDHKYFPIVSLDYRLACNNISKFFVPM